MPIKDKKQYNAYMRNYLPDYRKEQKLLLEKAKQEFGWLTPKQKQRSKKK